MFACCQQCPLKRKGNRIATGTVLLEVVLALALLLFAVAVISSGFSSSADAVERLQRHTHGLNLAVSVLSEMHMGIIPIENNGPQTFDPPFEDWTWETFVTPLDDGFGLQMSLLKVEVTVRYTPGQVVKRLTEIMSANNAGAGVGPVLSRSNSGRLAG